MKKMIIFIILLAIAIVVFGFIYIQKPENKWVNEDNNQIPENDEQNLINNTNSSGGDLYVGEQGSSGLEGNGSETSIENNSNSLPDDINERECGFYYSDYSVCAGTCPSGTCVSEGRSCYCKKQ